MKWIGYKSLTDIASFFVPGGIMVKRSEAKISITDTDYPITGTTGG